MDIKKIIKEEISDFGWVKDIRPNLSKGQKYRFKTPRGTYEFLEYCGEGYTEHPDSGEKMLGHRFKGENTNNCSRWWSDSLLQDVIENGEVYEYDPNWTIFDEFDKGTLDDIEGRNFIIYFKEPINTNDIIPLQERLFDMGFRFNSMEDLEEFRPVSNHEIVSIDCFNWDTSNPRYQYMDSNMRDDMVMLLTKPNEYPFSQERLNHENYLSVALDHDAILIPGEQYL